MFASLRTRSSPVVIVIYSRYLHGLYMAGAWKCQFKEEEEVEEGNKERRQNVGKDGIGMELGSVVFGRMFHEWNNNYRCSLE